MCRVPGHEALLDRPDLTAAAGPVLAVDRVKFLALGGYDPLYFPGRIEDLDLGFRRLDGGLEGILRAGLGGLSSRLRLVRARRSAPRAAIGSPREQPDVCLEEPERRKVGIPPCLAAGTLGLRAGDRAHRHSARRSLKPWATYAQSSRLAESRRSARVTGRRDRRPSSNNLRGDRVNLRLNTCDSFIGSHFSPDSDCFCPRLNLRRERRPMPRPRPPLVIDARPRGPSGPLAGERVLGRAVLEHLVELALPLGAGPITIHARFDEHRGIEALLPKDSAARVVLATGPPPEGSPVLRTDRLYDSIRLRRALHRGKDPEVAVIWRLDGPLGLAGADVELTRRRHYQPLGRFWALAPARWLARALCPTAVRPNALTLASGPLVIGAAIAIALGNSGLVTRLSTSLALAAALVLDTADGHLARLQGTSSAFGRWLDGTLDELGDMSLHAAVAWAAFVRDGLVVWLLAGMLYGMGKYIFIIASVINL